MKRADVMRGMRKTLLKRRGAVLELLDRDLQNIYGQLDPVLVCDRGDAAIDCERSAVSSGLATVESHELLAIDNALERIERGGYGRCEVCGHLIPLTRLHAVPFAARCVQCQREAEMAPS